MNAVNVADVWFGHLIMVAISAIFFFMSLLLIYQPLENSRSPVIIRVKLSKVKFKIKE